MPSQFKTYNPKFTNKLLLPVILPILELCRKGTHGAIHISTPKPTPENLTNNLAEKWFLKNELS